MKTRRNNGKRRGIRNGFATAVTGASFMLAGCGGGSGTFIDQNGQQVVGRDEPSSGLRAAVARIVTDPAPELQGTEDELTPLRTLVPLLSSETAPDGTGPEYDKALGLYVTRYASGGGRRSQFYLDAARIEAAGGAAGRPVDAKEDFASAYQTNTSVNLGALRGTKGNALFERRTDQTYRFSYFYQVTRDLRSATRESSDGPFSGLTIKLEGTVERDGTGRVERNGTTDRFELRGDSKTTSSSVSRVVRRPDRSGERRGTYTFSGDVITVRVTYGPGGTGTGTLTGTANGLPATIGVGERTTTVVYADGKTLDTFDLPQPTAQIFPD